MKTLAALSLLAMVLAQPVLAQRGPDGPSAGGGNAEQNDKPSSNRGGGGGSGSSNN